MPDARPGFDEAVETISHRALTATEAVNRVYPIIEAAVRRQILEALRETARIDAAIFIAQEFGA